MKTIIEIRPGSGGKEAELFVRELACAYAKYSRKNEICYQESYSGRTLIITVDGPKRLLDVFFNESGVHRVQRVTEMGGNKVHTFTVSVAVMNQADTTPPVRIRDNDLRIDYYRGSGNGGQHRNKTDSAVRITHFPSGIVVTCEAERSQNQNRNKAMVELVKKLTTLEQSQRTNMISRNRSQQVLHSEFSEARRTYNFIRNNVTDHILGTTASIKEFL